MDLSHFFKRSGVPVLCLSLLLCSCGTATSVPAETSALPETTALVSASVPETVPVQTGGLVEDLVFQGEHIEEGWIEPIAYEYHLPRILDDSPDAEAVNQELRQLGLDAQQGRIFYDSITWESHWNGTLVSLVVHLNRLFQDDPGAYTYNYDFGTRKTLSNEELLEKLGSDMETGQRALIRAAARQFDRDLLAGMPLPDDILAGLLRLRAETISSAGLDFSRVPLYLDDLGKLHGFGLIGTYAGAGAYTEDLTLELEPSELRKQADCGFLSAQLEDNAVFLTFRQDDLAQTMISRGSVDWGKPYPVEGLYGSYTDLAAGYLGNGGLACLFLLDENGQVTFCNLFQSIACGNRFTAVGPIQLPEKAVSFRRESDAGGSILAAVLESGEELDLSDAVYHWEGLPEPIHYGSSWYTGDGSQCLDFSGAPYDLRWRSGDREQAAGELRRYMGMTGEGMLYETWFLTREGQHVGTILTDACVSSYLYPEGLGWMTLEPFPEASLPGLPQGTSAKLHPELP